MADDIAAAVEGHVFGDIEAETSSSESSSSDSSEETSVTTDATSETDAWTAAKITRVFFRKKIDCFNVAVERVKEFVTHRFRRYGIFVGNHPLPFIVVPIICTCTLGLGIFQIKTESDIEKIYFPIDSRAQKEREIVRNVFPDLSFKAFNYYSRSDPDIALSLLFISKTDNLLETNALREIRGIANQVRELRVTVNKVSVKITYGCARVRSKCVVDGDFVLMPHFLEEIANKTVTFPLWSDSNGIQRDISTALSSVETDSGILVSAKVLRVSFKMAYISKDGQNVFKDFVQKLDPKYSTMTYAAPSSLSEEVDESTGGDIIFFIGTLVTCFIYALMVSSGGDPVSTRCLLALAGVTVTALSVAGAMGLLSICGVNYVNIVGVIPFLIMGIGIDDMFLLMSAWSETLGNPSLTVPERIGSCMSSAGVGITITSLTDFLAFAIGTSSVFRSVIYFSFYAGVAVLFCYAINATMFVACLAIHGRRVYSGRHFITCRRTKTKAEMKRQGAPACVAFFCSGGVPLRANGDDSLCERLPHFLLPKIVKSRVTCIFIIIGFTGYLVAAIYGVSHLKQGLLLQDLVQTTSYYYKYLIEVYRYFPESLGIGFIVNGQVDYSDVEGFEFLNLLKEAKQDFMVVSEFERCWLTSYLNSTFFNASTSSNSSIPSNSSISSNSSFSSDSFPSFTSDDEFIMNLKDFINATPEFQADVVFESYTNSVTASRCFVLSEKSHDQYAQAELMARLRVIADRSSLPVFVYHSYFTAFDQFLAILPATVQMLASAVGSMMVVTTVFLPHIMMVSLVMITIIMILLGIFGFMFFWNITLSPITMIHLVMSVGFSVDFSAHVCAAYLLSNHHERHERALDAVKHAASPVMNGALSTLLGVMFLIFSKSYAFVTFFKIMVLVMVLGLLHAVLFLPAVLSLIGPQNSVEEVWEDVSDSSAGTDDNRNAFTTSIL